MEGLETATPVGMARQATILGRSILVDIAHKVLKQRSRNRLQVLSDYDAGEWVQQRDAQNWLKSSDLTAYVERAATDRPITALIDGRLWRIGSRDYFRLRWNRITKILLEFAPDPTRLIELGSGTGMNLFALHLANHWRALVGLELSSTGIDVARRVADHYKVDETITFDRIDLLDPDSPGYARLKGETVFTHYCLEQLPNDAEAIFRRLIAAGIQRMVCIEPSFELLSPFSLSDLASMSYVWRQDYQRSIVRTARKLEAEGVLRIIAVRRLHFASSHRNPPTLLVWEPSA